MTSLEAPIVHSRIDVFAAGMLVVLCLVWGLNLVAIKVTNGGLQPVFQAGLRSLLAGALVVLWCGFRRVDLTARDRTLVPGLAVGLLFALEFLLIFVGLDYTTVSRGILFIYLTPIIVAVGAHFLIPGERLSLLGVIGLAAAFTGVAIAFSDGLDLPSRDGLLGDILCIAGAFGWAGTTLVIKTTRLRLAPPEKVLVYQLAASAVVLLALAPLFGPLVRDVTLLVGLTFAYQVVVVVAVTYLVWFGLLLRYPAGQLAAFTFLTPVFAVMMGAVLLREPITLRLVMALALVALGIALVSRRRSA